CLFEGIGKLDEPRLAASAPGEAYAKRRRLRVKALRKARKRRIRHRGEWNDDGRIAWSCRQKGPGPGGKQDGVEPFCPHDLIDAMRARQRNVLRAVDLVAGAIGLDVHLVGDV